MISDRRGGSCIEIAVVAEMLSVMNFFLFVVRVFLNFRTHSGAVVMMPTPSRYFSSILVILIMTVFLMSFTLRVMRLMKFILYVPLTISLYSINSF